MERKVLVTLSLAFSGVEEEDLHQLVAAMEEGMENGIAQVFEQHPDITQELLDTAIEFYGATVTLQRPLSHR